MRKEGMSGGGGLLHLQEEVSFLQKCARHAQYMRLQKVFPHHNCVLA